MKYTMRSQSMKYMRNIIRNEIFKYSFMIFKLVVVIVIIIIIIIIII